MDTQQKQMNMILKTRFVLVFIFGFTIGALTIVAWDSAPQQINKVGVSITTDTSGVIASHNAVATSTLKVPASFSTGIGTGRATVTNQPAGNTALVESVTVPPPGVWVAVRETKGKVLGNVLGAQRVRGPRSNVVIDLSRNTQPNKLYVIELYRLGVNGSVFDVKTESVYVDLDTGRGVIVPFRTDATSATDTATTTDTE